MTSYSVSYDLTDRLDLAAGINARLFPLMKEAVEAVAQGTVIHWKTAVDQAKLRSAEKDAYAKSITYRMTGDFSAVVTADYKYAQDIETGRPPRDLKKMLDTSMKVRRSKDGTRYLIIPFRHNADTVPKQAKMLTKSTITGQQLRVSGQAKQTERWNAVAGSRNARGAGSGGASFLVNQNKYQWGGKLSGPGVSKNQHGMYRFNTSTPGAPRSTYLTFRVMSEKSRGWIIPAQPGQYIAKGVAETMQPLAEASFKEAVTRSLG